jgi:acyl homoserine lactone synthase
MPYFAMQTGKLKLFNAVFLKKGGYLLYFMPASISIIEDIISKDKSSHWLREMLEHLRHL